MRSVYFVLDYFCYISFAIFCCSKKFDEYLIKNTRLNKQLSQLFVDSEHQLRPGGKIENLYSPEIAH